MRRICSWCGKQLETASAVESEDQLISHGVCDDCKFHIIAQNGMRLREYLNSFDAPVFIVDKDNRVKTSNTSAASTFKKDPPEMDEVLCGIVFECDHSHLPEGCGKTVHCSACTVRICILQTIETGRIFSRIPAYLDCSKKGTNKIHFLISTEKLGDSVLLRVEDVTHLNLLTDDLM